ncbi:MAG: tetratricopeptide repeat protein [Myxococcaceae bacterium]|nr:tetratricopeptide repeat protein [Myxococcaceae bacterium]MCA3011258.1 tetratricopeptide repeat protein [Myxococcaceae bacterium]
MRWLAAAWCGLSLACVTTDTSGLVTVRERLVFAQQKKDAAESLRLLERLRADAPAELDVARAWVDAHVRAGQTSALLARLATPTDAAAWYARGLALFADARDATGPALEAFERAIALAPGEGELHFRKGLALLESEKYEAAEAALTTAVTASPLRVGWQLPRAKALHRIGKTRDAIEAIRRVVTDDCTPQEAATARALMDEIADPFAGLPKAARPRLDQALNWLQVADVPQQAITELEELLREYPDLGVLHALLGLAAARVDDAGRAIEALKRAIELSPDDGKAYLYLADLYGARQRSTQAKDLYEKALEKNPCLEAAWFRLGDVALERQELARALVAFRTAVRLRPDDWFARGKLALVYQLEANWPAADRELKAELARNPENLEATLRLGLLHTDKFLKAKLAADRQVARVEAAKYLEQVLEQQPENALASRALERVKQP